MLAKIIVHLLGQILSFKGDAAEIFWIIEIIMKIMNFNKGNSVIKIWDHYSCTRA